MPQLQALAMSAAGSSSKVSRCWRRGCRSAVIDLQPAIPTYISTLQNKTTEEATQELGRRDAQLDAEQRKLDAEQRKLEAEKARKAVLTGLLNAACMRQDAYLSFNPNFPVLLTAGGIFQEGQGGWVGWRECCRQLGCIAALQCIHRPTKLF